MFERELRSFELEFFDEDDDEVDLDFALLALLLDLLLDFDEGLCVVDDKRADLLWKNVLNQFVSLKNSTRHFRLNFFVILLIFFFLSLSNSIDLGKMNNKKREKKKN